MTSNDFFIQKAFKGSKKGALHQQLGISPNHKIPMDLLKYILSCKDNCTVSVYGKPVKVTPLLKRRANFLLNVDRARH